MKLIIQSQVLREAINKVLSVVDKKNSRPILTNCLLKASGNKLELIASPIIIRKTKEVEMVVHLLRSVPFPEANS